MRESVSNDVTVDFDHHSSSLSVDPYSAYAAVRNVCPVAWSPNHGGFWVLTGFDAVFRAARDDDTFRSGPSVGIPSHGIDGQIPIDTDAPMTQKYRRLLQSRFSPAAAAEVEPLIRSVADERVDAFIETGSCDLMTDLATSVPAIVILQMLGFDADRWPDFTGWIHNLVHLVTEDPETALGSVASLYGAILDLIETRRTGGYRNDVVSELLQGDIDGRPLTEEEVANYTALLLLGGLDTSAAALGNTLVRLHRQPELRERLLKEPQLVGQAVEEFLRIDAPVQGLGRTLSRDYDLCGQAMKRGDRALLVWAAGNRDPAEFAAPDVVDLDRPSNRHLTFGVGLHRCLGSNHGRIMFRVMLETVLARIPDFELTENPDRYRFRDIGAVWGHHHLPARFTPGSRRDGTAR